jgi:hypothetical protein
MKDTKYNRARDAASSLDRFRRPAVRPRRGERKSYFERDCQTARMLWNDPNILGFGVGPKISQGGRSDFCLVFFVRKKLPKRRLRDLATIPQHLALDCLGLRVRTDVQEWGGPPIAHGPLPSSASIGDRAGNSGTMTLAVRDSSTGDPLILGCSHVLARCGAGQPGDPVESPADPRSDPRLNVVGRLVRFTEIDRRSSDNEVDAAVATPDGGVHLLNDIPRIGSVSGIRDLTLEGDSVQGLKVQKFGAVTGFTTGRITNLHVSTSIVYHQMSGDPSVDFIELVEYDTVSKEGDSGAAVLDRMNPPSVVGMHIAGRSDGTASLFTHIQFVFDAMQVNI